VKAAIRALGSRLSGNKRASKAMSKEADRAALERMMREAMEKKSISIKKGDTRIEAKCGKCGAPNRLKAAPGERRVTFTCKECGHRQQSF
jgi:transcription elongation factor Elf1